MSILARTLPPRFENLVRAFAGHGHQAAAAVLNLSDYYAQNPGAPTPWSEPFARPAYLAYYTPLNFVRLNAAFAEACRFLPAVSSVWDFGSGSGATQWVLEEQDHFAPVEFHCQEHSPQAVALHKELLARYENPRWQPRFNERVNPGPGALAVFSYSFLETRTPLAILEKFDHLLIVEPSTREMGRALMSSRNDLIAKNYQPLAPCTHSLACPLLTHSQKDWCHTRVHFDAPEWWLEIENFLPMKNRTLTYSYLLMSRAVTDSKWRGHARVIGDTLFEKGKTRQLMCRGSEREFLAWLNKKGEAPVIPNGALIDSLDGAELKSGEVRPTGPVTWTT